jgi:hypothetical protein
MWDLHMGYAAVWKILEEIIIELRKKGVETPAAVMNDLKSAKVLMNVLDVTERDRGEAEPKIEQYLGSVEAYLVTEAQKTFPPAHIDTWLRRIEEANCDTCQTCSVPTEQPERAEAKFITGVPRDQKWIRVKPLPNLPAEKLKQLAEETNLAYREENEHLIIHGTAENIKNFIKKMTQQTAKE